MENPGRPGDRGRTGDPVLRMNRGVKTPPVFAALAPQPLGGLCLVIINETGLQVLAAILMGARATIRTTAQNLCPPNVLAWCRCGK